MYTLDNKLRALAKSTYYQNLYGVFKDGTGVQLFDNTFNFSGIQVRFIYWCSVYDMLYEELLKHEEKVLTMAVIEDNYRTDAYLVYRNKKHDFLFKKYKREEAQANVKDKHPNKHKNATPNVIDFELRREG